MAVKYVENTDMKEDKKKPFNVGYSSILFWAKATYPIPTCIANPKQ